MSIDSIAQPAPRDNLMADFHRTFRSAFFGAVPHGELARDQHEPTRQPSLQGQRPVRCDDPSPLGTNRCARCGVISPLYQLWPTCGGCQDAFCFECQEPGSFVEEIAGCSCRACAEADRIAGCPGLLRAQITHAARFEADQSVLARHLRATWHMAPEDKRRLYAMFDGQPLDLGTLVRVTDYCRRQVPIARALGEDDVVERLIWLQDWCDIRLAEPEPAQEGQES